jgi:hypothetical protein
MNCPNCGYNIAKPYRVIFGPELVRWYYCPKCGDVGPTRERWESDIRIEAFQASMFRTITEANGSRTQAEEAVVRLRQPCGHPVTAIAYTDEGTHYCRECAREAQLDQKGEDRGI